MDSNSNFDQYLQHRMNQSGAMTPGQKLEIVQELQREAQEEGKVPVAHNTAARLDIKNPAVQAVLRGEEVSLGGTLVKKDGFKGLQDRRVLVGLIIGSMLLMIGSIVAGLRMMRPAEAEATPTAEASPTLEATQTPQPTPVPPTAVPPTQVPPPSPTAALIGIGGPAESSRDPASIEIAGRLFIVSKGIVDEENGIWKPAGPEWLEGTEVRRVFAVPYSEVRDLTVDSGAMVRVRTRGGAVLEYKVRETLRLMVSLRPSVVVFVPIDEGGDVNASERIAILAEAPLILNSATYETTANYLKAATNTAVNLRQDPGVRSSVLQGLQPNTALAVSGYPAVWMDGMNWIYVAVGNGAGGWVYGWVASEYIAYR